MNNIDYQLCTGDDCKLKSKCKRYLLHLPANKTKKKFNYYFSIPPFINKNGICECDFYIKQKNLEN